MANEANAVEQAPVETKGEGKLPQNEKKSKTGLIIGLVFLVLILGAGVAVFFNLGNIRNGVIIPALKNIPVVGNLIPSAQSDDIIDDAFLSALHVMSKEQLIELIQDMQSDYEDLQISYNSLNEDLALRRAEVESLQEVKEQQDAFYQDREDFDRRVAEGDAKAYADYYESIAPERAAELYQEAVATVQANKDVSKYSATYSEMEPSAAAEIMENLMRSDIDLVVLILRNIDTEQRAEILANMKASNASTLTRRIFP